MAQRRADKNPLSGQPLRVFVAPDKFKDSCSADEVAQAIRRGILTQVADAQIVIQPMADGGEGTVAALAAAGGTSQHCTVRGPLHDPTEATWIELHGRAYLEAAEANGLALVTRRTPDTAAIACSCGVGDLVRAALAAGHRDLVVGLGGSAATDGGAGLLRALGARIKDARGEDLDCGGAALVNAQSVELAGLDARLAATTIVAATDVDNPLLGAQGAAAVYGPQKGADAQTVAALQDGLRQWRAVLLAATGIDVDRPTAGAAGGTVAALLVLGATVHSGAELLIDELDIERQSAAADLLITGEGSLDAQSARGKTIAALAARARCPVYVIAGRITLRPAELTQLGIAGAEALTDYAPSVDSAVHDAERWLSLAAATIVNRYLDGV